MTKRSNGDRFRADLIPRGSLVLCAVSGGADSVYLLRRLYWLQPRRDIRVIAAHYNHGLRGAEADRDEAFVREFVAVHCPARRVEGWGRLPAVELVVGRGDVAAEAARSNRGIEETARRMRYDFLYRTAKEAGADVIVTAHNAEDNAETMLLHLLRGSGLRGLAGIAPRQGKLVRPMLAVRRRDIEAYLERYGLPHVEDSTNADDACARNRVRHRLTPLLEELAPGFVDRLIDTLPTLRADNDYLNDQAAMLVRSARREGAAVVLPAAAIAQAPPPIAARAARLLLEQASRDGGGWKKAHLDGLVELCRSGEPSARLSLPRGLVARREYERLVILRTEEAPPSAEAPLLEGENRWGAWRIVCEPCVCPATPGRPDSFYLVPGAYTIRARRAGDGLRPLNRSYKTLKKWMIDLKVPAHLRGGVPVLALAGRAVAAGGVGVDGSALAGPGEPCLHVRWERAGQEKEREIKENVSYASRC